MRREITLTSQGKLNVIDYLTKHKTLSEELSGCLIMSNCNFTKEYNLYKYQEAERVHQFLMGLDSSQFGIVRSNVLIIECVLNLDKVYSMVLREENNRI